MRILYVWHAAVIPEYRERFRAMVRLNPSAELHVVTPQGSWEGGTWQAFRSSENDSYRIRVLPTIWTKHPNAFFYRVFPSLFTDIKPDIVHIHEEPWTLVSGQMAALFWRKAPLIIETWENLDSRVETLGLPYRKVLSYVKNRTSHFIAGSPGARMVLERGGFDGHRISVVPYGTSVGEIIPQRAMHATPTIGYVGRLVEEKGILDLIQASRYLPAHNLKIVGTGPLLDFLKRRNHLEVIEGVDHAGISDVLRQIDILVLPSRTTATWAEQFGRVLIEAMAVGTVCVGSDSGEIPWVIGRPDLIYREGNVRDLANILEGLMSDPFRWQQISANLASRVRAHFTWDVTSKCLLNVYETAIKLFRE